MSILSGCLYKYSPRNDPQPWNDPQIDPEFEMIPISLHVDLEMIPI